MELTNNESNVNSEVLNPYSQLLADLSGTEEVSAEPMPEAAPEVIPDQTEAAAPAGPVLSGTYNPPASFTPVPEAFRPSAEEVVEAIANNAPNAADTPQPMPEKAPEAAPAAEEEPEIDFNSEEFMDRFYDNPAQAVEQAANQIANKKVKEAVSSLEQRLKPLLDESEAAQMKSEVKAVISDFVNTTDGAREMFPQIAEYIRSNNLDPRNRQSYVDGYKEATINKLRGENEALRGSQGRSLEDYLSDDASLDTIVNNENVSKKVIENYLKGLQNGGKPVVIGGGGTAAPSAQPVNSPRSLKDAAAMLRGQLSN